MANDPTAEKRLRNSRRFELVYSLLTPQEKEIALSGSQVDLEAVLRSKGIRDIPGTLLARQDWLASRIQAPEPEKPEIKEMPKETPGGNVFSNALSGWDAPFAPKPKPEPKKPEAEEKKDKPNNTSIENAPTQPKTRFDQMQKAGEKISETTPQDLAQLKSEWGEIESSVPSVSLNPQQENSAQEATKQNATTTPSATTPSISEIGYYPDPEIIPSNFDDWGRSEPIPEPLPEPQSTPQVSTAPSKARPAGRALRKRGRITKKALGKTLKSQGKKAVARTLLSTIEIWGPVVGVIFAIFLLVIIILILGCSVVNNPIGDFFGANYCGNNPDQVTQPPPGPQEKPTSVTFVGGEAYLATADGCRVNCPAGSKGDKVSVKVIIDVDTAKLDTNPSNLKANVQISNRFFANIETPDNPKPKIISVPVDTTYFIYQWSLPNTGGTKRHYEFTVSGTLQTDTGATSMILTMSGVTLTNDGGTSGENGGLFEGATARPSNNTCNGKYREIMTTLKKDFPQSSATNFGDPLCTYSEAKLNRVIEQTEANVANQNMWKSIAKCETNTPNGYGRNGAGGSWGKFQMRRSFPNPFKIWTQADDRGDVTWQKQVENAVSYNNSLARDGKNFSYWGTARCLCYYDKFKNTSACKDIIRRGEVRSPSGSCSACTAQEGKS